MGSVVEVGVFNGWAVANTQPWRATVTWLGGGTSVYSGGFEALSIGNQNTQITYAEWLLLPGNAGKTIDQYTTEGPHFEEYLPNGSFTVAAPWAALTPESIGVDPALTTFLSSASTMDGTEKAAVRGLIDAAAVGESLPAVGDDGEVLTVVGGTWESAPAAGGSTETAETIGQKLYAAGDLDRTPTDADAVAVLDESSSPTKGNGKRLTFASLWSWLQNKITSTALVFSARPAYDGSAAPGTNDLLRLADGDNQAMLRWLYGYYQWEMDAGHFTAHHTNGTVSSSSKFGTLEFTVPATANSIAFVRSNTSGIRQWHLPSGSATNNTVNWSKRTVFHVRLTPIATSAGETEIGILLGVPNTVTIKGDFSASNKGIGFKMLNRAISVRVANGTAVQTVPTGVSYLDSNVQLDLLLDCDGAGNWDCYINTGTTATKVSGTGAPTGIGANGHNSLNMWLTNGSVATQQWFYLLKLSTTQI
jgi:hypothetical protein